MKKLLFVTVLVLLMGLIGCVKRVEVVDNGQTIVIPEKAVPAHQAAVQAEQQVQQTETKVAEKEEAKKKAEQEKEEAKKNEADVEKVRLIEQSRGRLW